MYAYAAMGQYYYVFCRYCFFHQMISFKCISYFHSFQNRINGCRGNRFFIIQISLVLFLIFLFNDNDNYHYHGYNCCSYQ